MQTQYLLKLIQNGLHYRPVDPAQDVFALKGLVLGGVLFDQTNIVTVSGVNSLASVSSAVSGASSLRDDLQDLLLQSVSGVLFQTISGVSGASSSRDDLQDLLLQTVSGALYSRIQGVSGGGSLRDDLQDLALSSVSGSLQGQITAIATAKAKEERLTATAGQTLISLATINFDPSPIVRDIVVYKNASRVFMSSTGLLSAGDYVKLGSSQLQWLYGLQDGDRIIVRQERTGGGIGGGSVSGGVDLTNILVDPAPIASGAHALGTASQAWSGVYLKDTVINAVWHLQMVSGSLQIVQV